MDKMVIEKKVISYAPKKKMVKRFKNLPLNFFNGTSQEVIHKICALEKQYDSSISFNRASTYDTHVSVVYYSIESDKEFEVRCKKEEKQRKSDLKRLKTLLEKYEVSDVKELG